MRTRWIIILIVAAFFSLDALLLGGLWLWRRGTGAASGSSPESGGVLLTSSGGNRFVGDQLRLFTVDTEGVITTTKSAWFSLYYTEGKAFRLSGEVWLSESSGQGRGSDLPDGFALFLREWDSLHRYGLTSRSMDLKRRLHGGIPENRIVQVTTFEPPTFGAWLPFAVEASAESISFRLGDHSGVIQGPLDVDGANKVALAPGTKLKSLRLEIDPGK